MYLTDTEWLLLVLAVIYLVECACWLRREAVCFSSLVRKHAPIRAPDFLGNIEKGLIITNPLPTTSSFVCESWPVAISPDGICLPDLGPYGLGLEGGATGRERRVASSRYVAFAAVRTIERYDREVYVNGMLAGISATVEHGRLLAAMLRELKATPDDDRAGATEERLRRFTDIEAAAVRVSVLGHLSRSLRISATILFLHTFAYGPLLYYGLPAQHWSTLWIYLLGFVLCWGCTIADYASLRRELLGEPRRKRLRHLGMLMLSPASAMRSAETLLRNSLAEYHPLAAGAALCSREAYSRFAKHLLLALRHPRPLEVPAEPAARRVYEWFSAKLMACLEQSLAGMCIDVADLTRPPVPLDDARCYCPRCHNQFVLATGFCADCGGMLLVPFGVAAS